MQNKKKIGRLAAPIGRLGLGGAPLGDLYERISTEQALSTVRHAYELGITLFDTAPLYGHGLSEHRFGHVLREQPRDSYILSTKVGRYLTPARDGVVRRGQWCGGLNMHPVLDYSYDGTLRSLEQSFQRLGIERIDIALIHDVDVWTHGSQEAFEQRFREATAGAYRALERLRTAGDVNAIGVGVNDVQASLRFLQETDVDVLMLAGRYTLLEQTALDELLPLAERKGVSVLIAGPYNSGILASGAQNEAKYNYRPAAEHVIQRTRELTATCIRHDVPLAAAALQFPMAHPAVEAVLPGAISPEEVSQNVRLAGLKIPSAFWDELRDRELIRPDAPLPDAR